MYVAGSPRGRGPNFIGCLKNFVIDNRRSIADALKGDLALIKILFHISIHPSLLPPEYSGPVVVYHNILKYKPKVLILYLHTVIKMANISF